MDLAYHRNYEIPTEPVGPQSFLQPLTGGHRGVSTAKSGAELETIEAIDDKGPKEVPQVSE